VALQAQQRLNVVKFTSVLLLFLDDVDNISA